MHVWDIYFRVWDRRAPRHNKFEIIDLTGPDEIKTIEQTVKVAKANVSISKQQPQQKESARVKAKTQSLTQDQSKDSAPGADDDDDDDGKPAKKPKTKAGKQSAKKKT